MKVVNVDNLKIIMSNEGSRHNYFAWPTATRLQNGKIAVVASGFRLRHICPFGKSVIAFSENEGESYSAPAPVIDTVLDDRDGGIMTFGESGVIVTSFNNTLGFQRSFVESNYDKGYHDMITPEEEKNALGASFRMSFDCAVTFGKIHKSPVTSPHGPIELADGTILWIGRTFSPTDEQRIGIDCIQAHKINLDGSMEYVGEIENIKIGEAQPLSCEPHAVVSDDGSILCHIRVQCSEPRVFTVYQSKSCDGSKTWSKPKQILPILGGSPPHLLKTSSGIIVCTYACREAPHTIRVMFSRDNGKNWSDYHEIYVNGVSRDLGYPSSVELKDGSFITVFYAHLKDGEPAIIAQQKWRLEDCDD